MMNHPFFTGRQSFSSWKKAGSLVFRDHRYWIVLIGLLHGVRREEPVLLKVKHVKCLNGIWYFDLLEDKLFDLLKDVGTPRQIPIHKNLIELGFIQARVTNRHPEERLFPEAKSYAAVARDAGPFGSWFKLFRDDCGITDEEVDFHAFRHTVVNRLTDVGVPKSHTEEIVGHESKKRRSEMDTYDHGRIIKILKAGIDRLDVPIPIEELLAAVARSDASNKLAAWPKLDDPDLVPKPKKPTLKTLRTKRT